MRSGLFTLERVTGPEIEPITLAEMKRSLRMFASVTTEDADVTNLIVAAREWVEDYTGRALVDQSWRLTIGSDCNERLFGGDRVSGYSFGYCGPGFYSGSFMWPRLWEIMLRKAPVLAITSFVSVDNTGAETDILAGTYELREKDSKWPHIVMLNGSLLPNVTYRIVFRAGFSDRDSSPQQGAEVVPVRFLQAMKLWAEANYDRDEKMMPLLLKTAEDLIRSERAELGMA